MRATEFLTEQTSSDGSTLITTSGDLWLWQVPNTTYDEVYKNDTKNLYSDAIPVPPGAGKIYYVSDQSTRGLDKDTNQYVEIPLTPDKAVSRWRHEYRFLTVVDGELISLAGRKNLTPGLLKKLVKITGAQSAPTILSDDVKHHVLHNGQVTHIKIKRDEFALAPLSDGSQVYKVPKNLLWTTGIRVYDDHERNKHWDTRWQIDSPIAGVYTLVSLGNHITGAHYPSNKANAALKEIRELVNRENLTLGVDLPDVAPPKTGKPKTVKPGSVMHKMLTYISEHPGSSRSDWYVKHLGLSAQGMAGWTDDKSHDGVAAAMGWIKNSGAAGKYSLSITPTGKLVLARLNSGNTVQHTKQV